jgi:hypothetical protein
MGQNTKSSLEAVVYKRLGLGNRIIIRQHNTSCQLAIERIVHGTKYVLERRISDGAYRCRLC